WRSWAAGPTRPNSSRATSSTRTRSSRSSIRELRRRRAGDATTRRLPIWAGALPQLQRGDLVRAELRVPRIAVRGDRDAEGLASFDALTLSDHARRGDPGDVAGHGLGEPH